MYTPLELTQIDRSLSIQIPNNFVTSLLAGRTEASFILYLAVKSMHIKNKQKW